MKTHLSLILTLVLLASCKPYSKEDLDYISKVTHLDLKTYVIQELHSQTSDFHMKKLYAIKDVDRFYEKNKRYRIDCTLRDSVAKAFRSDKDYCLGSDYKDGISWSGLVNNKTSYLYIEVSHPDFSGQ